MKTLLLGLRGSGKSTVGRRLAARLGVPFVDLDARTLALTGRASVRAVFAIDGEDAWRRAEVASLAAVLDEPGSTVVALGGGTPTAAGAETILERARAVGRVRCIYLRLAPAAVAARIHAAGRGDDRPGLPGAGGDAAGDALEALEAEAAWTHGQRDATFERVADLVVELGTVMPATARTDRLRLPEDADADAVVEAVAESISR